MESEDSLTDGTISALNIANTSMNGYIISNLHGGNNWHPTSNHTINYSGTTSYTNPVLDVNGNATIHGNLIVGGVNISETLKAIETRLSILTPDPKKLAKYEALQKAYNHYKTMEAMCDADDDENGSR